MSDDFLPYALIASVTTCVVLVFAYLVLYGHVRRLRDEHNVLHAIVRLHNDWFDTSRTLLVLHHAHLQPEDINEHDPMSSDVVWQPLHPLLRKQLTGYFVEVDDDEDVAS